MTDSLTPTRRSWNMSRIRGKNTLPERAVASSLRRLRLRFVSHAAELPGTPDFLLRGCKTVIFVHGCYWHRHALRDRRCQLTCTPKSGRRGRAFWLRKFHQNVVRDQRTERRLRRLGWRVINVWQCQLRDPDAVAARLERLLCGRGLAGAA